MAPYKDQVKRIKQILPEYKNENIILTVHKSQGREWDTVIYSVCDIDNGLKPWFTDSLNSISNGIKNINTAISRARKRLVIFCNKGSWIQNNNQLIAGLISCCTGEMTIDLQEINLDISQLKYFNRSKVFKQSFNINNDSNNDDGNEVNIKDQWESPTLYWSKYKREGYTYSAKKDAWWKKK